MSAPFMSALMSALMSAFMSAPFMSAPFRLMHRLWSDMVYILIMYIKKILDSDWPREM